MVVIASVSSFSVETLLLGKGSLSKEYVLLPHPVVQHKNTSNAKNRAVNFVVFIYLTLSFCVVTYCYIFIVTNSYNKNKGDFMKGLREIRKKRNLNQQKVAMDLHISRESLSYYENGKREPSLMLLVEMSNYFNVSINYLITGEEFCKR